MKCEEFKFRCTEWEIDQMKYKAALCGIPVSKYVRCLIQGKPLQEKPPKEFSIMLAELKRIQNNLNQISTMASAYELPEADYAHRIATDTWKYILQIEKAGEK